MFTDYSNNENAESINRLGIPISIKEIEGENIEFRLAGLAEESTTDGPGFRLTIFAQGCHLNCPDCHNPESHDIDGGEIYSSEKIYEKLKSNPLYAGITLSGGEPFLQPEALSKIARDVKAMGFSVVTFTGFTLEHLEKSKDPFVYDLLKYTDLLIDGPYLKDKRALKLRFRGSENQRLLINE